MASKKDMAAVGLLAGLWLLLSGKKSNAPTGGGAGKDADLLRRANQSRAREWIPILVYDLDEPQAEAEAEARWFGIESGGDPSATSSQGERGLTQITKTSALTEGALSQKEWDALADVTTSPQDDAVIALKVIDWTFKRASKYIAHPPTDPIERIFYAKLYHQSPVDVRDAKLTGDAHADSASLEKLWANDPKKLHYLHAANAIAWNSLTPPTGGPAS